MKISVLVPIYNAEKYLEQCLESLSRQTLKDCEIICINDGSTDSSELIIDKYVSENENFIKLNKTNSGYGASMNAGLRIAKGDYIGIVESDDFVADNMYERLYEATQNGTIDMVKCGYWELFDGENAHENPAPIFHHIKPPSEVFTVYEYENIISYFHPSIWAGIYRRKFLEEEKIVFVEPPGAGWADNPFLYETVCSAKKITWVGEPFYHYRITNMDSSSYLKDCSIPVKRLSDIYDVIDKRNIQDINILACMYGRTIMYVRDIMTNPYYDPAKINPLVKKLFSRIKYDVLIDRGFNKEDISFYKCCLYLNDEQTHVQKSFSQKIKDVLHLNKKTKCDSSKKITNNSDNKSKILFYNWAQFDERGMPGGGVTKYLYNVISHIVKNEPELHPYFLSSGYHYNTSAESPYIKRTLNKFDGKCESFEIVNSLIPAPAYFNCRNLSKIQNNEIMQNMLYNFLDKQGPFKAIYFANMEGISIDIDAIKKKYPGTKIVIGLHNYIPICPEVFLFKLPEKRICAGILNENCPECINCKNEQLINDLKWRIQRQNKHLSEEWFAKMGFDKIENDLDVSAYKEYLKYTQNMLYKADACLAVSKRVKDIFVKNGANEENIFVSYIGTDVAEHQIKHSTCTPGKYTELLFMGYANSYEKGFPFLVNALNKLDNDHLSKINLKIAASGTNKHEIEKLSKKVHSITIIEGYTHSDFPKIMNGVHLGIVPVMWEDNLPQVAIEMVSFGIPILCSDYGGASELTSTEAFKYKGGDVDDFNVHLSKILDNPEILKTYWEGHKGLVTMSEHIQELKKYLL